MNDRFMLIDMSNKMICEGLVKEFWRDEAVFKVEHGIYSLKSIERGQWLRFVFLQRRKGIFEGKVTEVNGCEIIIEEINSIADSVKEDIRIKTNIETKLFCKDSVGRLYSWHVTIKDISAGGLNIESKYRAPLERVLEVAVPWNSSYVIVNIILLREILKDNFYYYGCKYFNLLSTEENMIRNTVFKIAAKKAGKLGGKQ
ncbi:MAG: PilZ domain-containing protein [Clostridiales bacterium]|nr:PilZ domain-containing protein [Clostridiales bacterium]